MKKKYAILMMPLLSFLLFVSLPAFAAPAPSVTVSPQTTGSLIISSAFAAPEGFNPHKVFTFVVRDSSGQVAASLTITGQGSVTVTGLTIGETYTVTEEYPCEKGYGYKIEVSGAADKNGAPIRIGGLPQRVDFLTRYVSGKPASVPKTGDDDTLPLLYALAAVAGVGSVILMAAGKRKGRVGRFRA